MPRLAIALMTACAVASLGAAPALGVAKGRVFDAGQPVSMVLQGGYSIFEFRGSTSAWLGRGAQRSSRSSRCRPPSRR